MKFFDTREAINFLFSHIKTLPNSDCLYYTTKRKQGTYPQFQINDQYIRLNRLVLECKLERSIEHGKIACHTCDNTLCVNPEHIYEGTRSDNTQDSINRKRYHRFKGEDHGMAYLTEEKIKKAFNLRLQGMTIASIAEQLNCTIAILRSIFNGYSWKHVTRPENWLQQKKELDNRFKRHRSKKYPN